MDGRIPKLQSNKSTSEDAKFQRYLGGPSHPLPALESVGHLKSVHVLTFPRQFSASLLLKSHHGVCCSTAAKPSSYISPEKASYIDSPIVTIYIGTQT